MLRVEGLSKSYGSLEAVKGISFEVRDGEVFGLLGPNGAGKTTTLHLISGVLRPDAGRILVDGQDVWVTPREVKRLLGVVPQEIAVYEELTARDNLSFWGSLYGLRGPQLAQRVEEVLSRVGLADRAGDRVKGFSGGMKRRLNLSMGLLHKPRFLLLDEPTVGIDPQARLNVLEVIREVAGAGTSVLYTTHYMEEAQELCDRLAIIDRGELLAEGTVDELTRLAGEGELLRVGGSFEGVTLRERLEAIAGVRILHAETGSAALSVDPNGPGLLEVLPQLLHGELGIEDVSIQQPSLQSAFIRLTGRELRD